MLRNVRKQNISSTAKFDAAQQAEVREQWRDWVRYLQAHQRLLTAQQAEMSGSLPSFERTEDAWEVQRERGESELRQIPAGRRGLFDRVRELARQQVQIRVETEQRTSTESHAIHVDPSIVERIMLDELLVKAQGGDSGWGQVPLGEDEWYAIETAALLGTPHAAEYALGDTSGNTRRRSLIALAITICVGLILIYVTWPSANPTANAARRIAMTINGTEVQPWIVSDVDIHKGDGSTTTLVVTATTKAAWTSNGDQAAAFWRTQSVHPVEVCIPQLEQAVAVTLHSVEDLPYRRYTLQDTAPSNPDLVLESCGNAETTRYGVLSTVAESKLEQLDQPVSLTTSEVIRVHQPVAIGPEEDPSLPAGQYWVRVSITTQQTFDWSVLSPTLLFIDGSSALPSDRIVTSEGIDLRYLVPAFEAPIDAAWTIKLPRNGRVLRWRMGIKPPLSHAEMLNHSLQVTDVSGKRSSEDSLQLSFRLHNRGKTPLLVNEEDLSIVQGTKPVVLLPVASLRTALTPNEQRDVTVVISKVDLTQEMILTIGTERFSLRF